jgi:hypothetical protein
LKPILQHYTSKSVESIRGHSNDYDHPGESLRARARHAERIDRLAQEISAALATAAGV